MVLTGEENTKHWCVLLAFAYDTVTPRFVMEKTGIKRANVYLLELTNEGYLIKDGFGRYKLNEDAFIDKWIEENGILVSSKEKEFLKDLLFNKVIVKDMIKDNFEMIQIRPLTVLNPYRFFTVMFHNLVKTVLIKTVRFISNLMREVYSDEEVIAIQQKLKSLQKDPKEIEDVVKSKVSSDLLDRLIEQQLESGISVSSLKVISKHKKEFVDLVYYFLSNEIDLQTLERIIERIERELEKDPLFSNFIKFNEMFSNAVIQVLTSLKGALKEYYKKLAIEFYNNLLKDLEQNKQQPQ